jgi:pseudouridine-5'-phosphate glycosidase
VHGVPRDAALPLHRELAALITERRASPALVGVIDGAATVGISDAELGRMLDRAADAPNAVPKANAANLGVLAHWGATAATTVSATMELAALAGVRVFATGGLGGVHNDVACSLDISSDLAAFTRFPLAVVCSGVKSILHVAATRETLETLGVPVIGFQTGAFPAFYTREAEGAARVDARFDEVAALANFLVDELTRTSRGVVIANPIDEAHELDPAQFQAWRERAEGEAEDAGVSGRAVTPFVLERLHELSGGATLAANIELVKSNADLAARLAAAMAERRPIN